MHSHSLMHSVMIPHRSIAQSLSAHDVCSQLCSPGAKPLHPLAHYREFNEH